MGQQFYICESGTGKPISDGARRKLDAFISQLSELSAWGAPSYKVQKQQFVLSYVSGYLEIVVYNLRAEDRELIRQIVAYSRTLGLNLFVDVGDPSDEMEAEDISEMLGPVD